MAGYKPAIMTSRHSIERNDNMTPQRYNSAIQRVKGFLELASGLYDTSLSYQTQRAAEGVLQTGFAARLLFTIVSAAARQTGRMHLALVRGGQFSRDQIARGGQSLRRVDQSLGFGDPCLSWNGATTRPGPVAEHRDLSFMGCDGFCRS